MVLLLEMPPATTSSTTSRLKASCLKELAFTKTSTFNRKSLTYLQSSHASKSNRGTCPAPAASSQRHHQP